MSQVKLIPKSRHGSNRVRQHGNVYDIINQSENFFHLQSLNNTFNDNGRFSKDIRVVKKTDDPNFDCEIVSPAGC